MHESVHTNLSFIKGPCEVLSPYPKPIPAWGMTTKVLTGVEGVNRKLPRRVDRNAIRASVRVLDGFGWWGGAGWRGGWRRDSEGLREPGEVGPEAGVGLGDAARVADGDVWPAE